MRRSRSSEAFDGFAELAAANLAVWAVLDESERESLVAIGSRLVMEARWEASRGFELTDEIVTTIAGGAALLALGLDPDCYDHVRAIVVHPRAVSMPGVRAGPIAGTVTDTPQVLLGQAGHGRGAVLIAWSDARRAARRLVTSNNVVWHEFAHKLDMLDGTVDGTPPIEDQAALDEWVAVCTPEYERLRAGAHDSLLRSYAATDPGEFFAVATEVFFGRSVALRDEKPDLYRVLSRFYRQDPARRFPSGREELPH